MSAVEHDGAQPEARSSVKVITAAKGEIRFEVKVYEGADICEVNAARELAVHTYRALERDLATGGAT